MATIDDLNEQGVVRATLEDKDTPQGLVAEVRLVVTIPIELLDTISGGSTRSQVMVRDWLKVAMENAP